MKMEPTDKSWNGETGTDRETKRIRDVGGADQVELTNNKRARIEPEDEDNVVIDETVGFGEDFSINFEDSMEIGIVHEETNANYSVGGKRFKKVNLIPSASASGAKQMVQGYTVTTSLFNNAIKPPSQEENAEDDGTTVSKDGEEEIGEPEKLSRTHVTGTTSSSDQVQIQISGLDINESSQIANENTQSDSDISLLEADSEDNLLACEIISQETRCPDPEIPVSTSARLNENISEASDVPSIRRFQGFIVSQRLTNLWKNTSSVTLENDRGNTNCGGSSGREMSSINRSAIQRTPAQFMDLIQINLQNSQNLPIYTVPTEKPDLFEHPPENSYKSLKSAFINPRVLIRSNERLLAEAAMSLPVVSNNLEDQKQSDERSELIGAGAAAKQEAVSFAAGNSDVSYEEEMRRISNTATQQFLSFESP